MSAVFSKRQKQLYSVIDEYDKSAFIAVGEAGEIIGEGFKIHKNG